MREPKFSVGERVILVSKNQPHLNGQTYNVLMIVEPSKHFVCPFTGKLRYLTGWDGYCYILDDASLQGNNNSAGVIVRVAWVEGALRKIPPTSGDSFQQMMEKLRQGETELV